MLSSVLHAHLAELFPGRKVVGYSQFRVTRDADLWIDEEEVKNLRQALQGELPQRQFGSAVRLEVAAECPAALAQFLLQQFGLTEADLYRCDGPVNIARLSSLVDQVDIDALKYEPFVPGVPARLRDAPDILAAIREHDILLHHPYQSFEPVVEFIRRAAEDADVVAIKQTVYRTGVNSVLMEALIEAARRGKEVTVVVELMARFDEEANINWAERLERAGAQVVYGVFGLKTHAKLALLIRRERDARGRARLVPYAHLGTGNYHPRTTRLYTDFGLLTADPDICADVNEVFLHITSLAKAAKLKRLLLAPFTMHRRVLDMIRREIRHARDGRPARIIAKMNALVEDGVIRALYAASAAGVKIDLIVRGACALRPGVPGISENIRVRSILGRFLEHHRVWYFENGGAPDVWLASADWMGRNLFRRVEVAFPVQRPRAAQAGRRRGPQGLSRRQQRGVGTRRRGAMVQGQGAARDEAPFRAARTPRADARPRRAGVTGTPHGPHPLAALRSGTRRTRPRAPAHVEGRQAGGAHGGVAGRAPARHVPDPVVAGRPRAADGARAEAPVQDGAGTGARRVGGEHSRRGQLARLARARADRRAPAVARRRRFVPAVGRGGVLVGAQGRRLVAVQPREGGRRGGRAQGRAGAGLRVSACRRFQPAMRVSVRALARARESPGPPTLRARRPAGATSADARRASASRSRT